MLVLKEESLFGRFFCNWDFILGQDGLQILFPNTTRIKHSVLKNYGEGNGTPLQYSCLENPMDRGAW